MEWYVTGVLVIAALCFLMLLGLPIAFSLGLLSVLLLVVLIGPNPAVRYLGGTTFNVMTMYALTSLPLFILMGELLIHSRLGEAMFEAAHAWLGFLPGGLALATIGAGTLFATMSGASIASTVTIGGIAVPEMLSRGYSKRLAAGAAVSGGGLAHLIPPSGLMIIYASFVEQSVGEMFMAGFIPGFLLAGLFMVCILVQVRINPRLAPKGPVASWKKRLLSLAKVTPAAIIVFLVLGTIYTGVATATEAAAMGAFGTLVMCLVTRRLNRRLLKEALIKTAQTTCFILLIVVGAKMFSFVLTYLQIPQQLVGFIAGLSVPPLAIIALMQVMYIFLGMFFEGTSMILISLPVVYPVLVALDFSPIWFGILLMINIEMALITPPVALGLYALKGVVPAEISMKDIVVGAVPFMLCDSAAIALVMFLPQLALWLPNTMRA